MFYKATATGTTCVLKCCEGYPFEIHEVEYASAEDFNDAVDHGEIKYICSKDPTHARAHIYKESGSGPRCLDCLQERKSTR